MRYAKDDIISSKGFDPNIFGLTLKNTSKTTLDSEITAINMGLPSTNSRNSERFIEDRTAQASSPSKTLNKILVGKELLFS